jgi:peptide/nickel transport system permease protein
VTALVELESESRSRRGIVLRRVVKNRSGVIGLVLTFLVLVVTVFAPLLAPYDPNQIVPGAAALASPSAAHWFGTDELGRDVASRVILGSRSSLQASVLATLIALAVAVPIGITAGYFRGPWDALVMRINDTVLAFPFIVLAVGLAAILGPSLLNAAIAIGVSQVPQMLRVTRGESLALREEDFVTASRADGAGHVSVMRRHVAPNLVNTVIVQATLMLPFAIVTESMLSFLGLGVQPPTASWGVMLTTAQAYTSSAPFLAVFPGLAIFISALALNLLGDGLRDALDPKANR